MSSIKDTSRLAYEKIMLGRDNHYKKIILAMEWIIEGTSWDIAKQSRLKPDQVWKRISELTKPDENGQSILIDTGKRNLNPDGNLAIVYGLFQNKANYKPVERFNNKEMKAADYASVIIAKTKQGKLVQKNLFEETEK